MILFFLYIFTNQWKRATIRPAKDRPNRTVAQRPGEASKSANVAEKLHPITKIFPKPLQGFGCILRMQRHPSDAY
jgi:hypothetical protein